VTTSEPLIPQPPLLPGPARRWSATRTVLLVLLAAVLGGTAWIVRVRTRASAAGGADAARSAAADRVVPVLTSRVEQRDVPMLREGLGNVAAFYTVTVKPQVDGRIDRVLFKEGQRVKKGDVLVQIDPRPFAIQLQSAQAALARDTAQLKNGQLNLERYQTLSSQNLIAPQQMTDQLASVAQLDAQVQSDQAQMAAARLNLDYARVTTPIDGVTGVRLVDPGNVVHASDPGGLVVVAQLDPIAVLFTLPEDDLASIIAAMDRSPLTVEALSRDGETSLGDGKLSVIDNEINQATATIRLKAIFDNPKHLLWPNQFVKARLNLATRNDAIVIPAAVVQHGPQGTFAYVVGAESTASVRPITVDAIQGDIAVVSQGLQAGEEVVVDGQAQIRPHARVSARPASSAPAQPPSDRLKAAP
jgi:multidrug efflux system membrane fusion protein